MTGIGPTGSRARSRTGALAVLFCLILAIALGFASIAILSSSAVSSSGLAPARNHLAPSGSLASPYSILVVSPTNGTIFTGGQPIAISFALTGSFAFVAPIGQSNVVGQGHMHVLVDGAYYELVDTVSTIFLVLPDGWHNVTLQLVNNDHTPLAPNVQVMLHLALTHGPSTATPTVAILNPGTASASLNGSIATISFVVSNFYLTQPTGQPNAPNEGHVHVLLDGKYYELVNSVSSAVLTGLTAGTHVVVILLANNDHSSYLDPTGKQISASVTLAVTLPSSPTPTAPSTSGLATTSQANTVEAVAIGALVLALVAAILAGIAAARAGRTPKQPS